MGLARRQSRATYRLISSSRPNHEQSNKRKAKKEKCRVNMLKTQLVSLIFVKITAESRVLCFSVSPLILWELITALQAGI